MRTTLSALAAPAMLAGLSACNTMRGIGEDISALGRYISNSSGTSSSHQQPAASGLLTRPLDKGNAPA